MKLKNCLLYPVAIVIAVIGILAVDVYLSIKKLTTISEWWWKHGYKWIDYLLLGAPLATLFIFVDVWAGLLWFGGMVCCHFGDKRVFNKN